MGPLTIIRTDVTSNDWYYYYSIEWHCIIIIIIDRTMDPVTSQDNLIIDSSNDGLLCEAVSGWRTMTVCIGQWLWWTVDIDIGIDWSDDCV